jgi:spore coat protein SA
LHILIIAPEQNPVPPAVGGSVEHCIFQISRQFPSGHRVTIISRKRSWLPAKSIYGHVTVLRIKGGSRKQYLARAICKAKGGRYDMIQIDNRPSFVPAVRCAFPQAKIAVFLHSLTFVSPPMTSRSKAQSDLAGADLIIANSQSLRQSLRSKFPKVQGKVKYVHLGVDLQQFQPEGRAAGRKGGRFTVLFAGRLIPRKGLSVLIRAVGKARKTVSGMKLVAAGGSPRKAYKASLERLAARNHVPVTFKGYVSRSGMPAFYRSGDCFVCPSQKHEAFGLVNIEAMASGLPCIASRNGGIPEIIRHRRSGLLVADYRSPDAFARQLVKLARKPGLAARLGREARADALRRFSWSSTAAKVAKLYAAAVERAR